MAMYSRASHPFLATFFLNSLSDHSLIPAEGNGEKRECGSMYVISQLPGGYPMSRCLRRGGD